MDYAELVDDLDGALAAAVVDDALAGGDAPAVAWTGSIESTVLLWLAVELGDRRPDAGDVTGIFVDHGCHVNETREFVTTVADAWDVPLVTAANDALTDAVGADATADVDGLPDRDRRRLRRAGHEESTVALDPRTATGRLLLEAGPLRDAVAERGHDVLLVADREGADGTPDDRVYVESLGDGVRVAPLTHLTERGVWRIAIDSELPVNPAYGRGHRTVRTALGGRPADDRPAWEQVLTDEDGGGHGARPSADDHDGSGGGATDDATSRGGEPSQEGSDEEERSLMDRLREAGS